MNSLAQTKTSKIRDIAFIVYCIFGVIFFYFMILQINALPVKIDKILKDNEAIIANNNAQFKKFGDECEASGGSLVSLTMTTNIDALNPSTQLTLTCVDL